ncbi:hypothetical protein NB646_08150 [Oxalobacter aliiformigenes]|uniref:Uncharacterized protein n=1 Tax=Oxalobacter aliiformigenes TaxID=2946593 RepID=A0A9E9LCL1_9BURK|nr:hypothetical protein [Oxalobacter aliiformigenes]WAV90803.1 hypothetical protein NB646_08150 [Oxalobacter aliiformigenes]
MIHEQRNPAAYQTNRVNKSGETAWQTCWINNRQDRNRQKYTCYRKRWNDLKKEKLLCAEGNPIARNTFQNHFPKKISLLPQKHFLLHNQNTDLYYSQTTRNVSGHFPERLKKPDAI